MILAAGRGERMRPLTDHCPKPLIEVAGKPLIVRHLERLSGLGFRDVIINLSWLGHMIEDRLGDGSAWGLRIHYSHEQEALETGGGICRALPLLGEAPFFLINGDVLTDINPYSLRLGPDDLCAVALVHNPAHNHAGDFSLERARLRPGHDAAEGNFTYSGVAMIRPALVKGQPTERFPLGRLLADAAAEDRASGFLHEGMWLDVGTPGRLAKAEAVLRGED
jgi:MurNAc alpha-1-phosphate uridylyltransferase